MSRLSTRLDRWFPRTRAMRRLTRLASATSRVPVFIDRKSVDLGIYGLLLRKERGGVALSCNLSYVRRNPVLVPSLNQRPCAAIALFAATSDEIRTCRAEFSDGYASEPGVVSYSSAHRGAVLVPDWEFFVSRGYAAYRQPADPGDRPWVEREDTIVWRGSTTGRGEVSDESMSAANRRLIQRTRLCLILRDVAGTDVRLVNAIQTRDPSLAEARLRTARILGPRVPPTAWRSKKFAIDIDGNASTYTNLFTRLLFGCCVIKIASPLGYRQWYYDDLVPWRHYVPVGADMSDLLEKIDWCRSHPGECEAIAAGGRALALSMTFERETARGISVLNASLARG